MYAASQDGSSSSFESTSSDKIFKVKTIRIKLESKESGISSLLPSDGIITGNGNETSSEFPEEIVFKPTIKDGHVLLSTRPLKLTGDYSEKKPVAVTLIWSDGKHRSFKIYGAFNLNNTWHIIGRSAAGNSLRLRGSGWRFFKFDIWFPISDLKNPTLKKFIPKPIIRFSFIRTH